MSCFAKWMFLLVVTISNVLGNNSSSYSSVSPTSTVEAVTANSSSTGTSTMTVYASPTASATMTTAGGKAPTSTDTKMHMSTTVRGEQINTTSSYGVKASASASRNVTTPGGDGNFVGPSILNVITLFFSSLFFYLV